METRKYQGILSALLTPFTDSDEVNYSELKKIVQYQLKMGIDGFYVGGSTSEAFLLTKDERKNLLKAVLEANNGSKTVVFHVGSISTAEACELAEYASLPGVDAVSAISPFYYKFTNEEILNYYLDIMKATDKPMFIYNFPNLSGYSLDIRTLDTLCAKGNVAGVKFTSNNFFDLERMKNSHPELVFWNGYDEMLLSGLAAGADGAVGSTYNILCPIAKKVYNCVKAGDIETARTYQAAINQVVVLLIKHKNTFGVEKALMDCAGFHMGGTRRPFLPLPKDALTEIGNIYKAVVEPYC
jgi:N-acetylneuraminate lyase